MKDINIIMLCYFGFLLVAGTYSHRQHIKTWWFDQFIPMFKDAWGAKK